MLIHINAHTQVRIQDQILHSAALTSAIGLVAFIAEDNNIPISSHLHLPHPKDLRSR